jgi:hypothetical protein
MKLSIFLAIGLLLGELVNAQSAVDFANLTRYKEDNTVILNAKKKVDVVFMGNSITEGWVKSHPEFFLRIIIRAEESADRPLLKCCYVFNKTLLL